MHILRLKRRERLKNGLLKIGEIAKEAGLLPSCVRFYTQLGFLKVNALTQGGYWLYEKEETLKALGEISELIKKGISLDQIKKIRIGEGKMEKYSSGEKIKSKNFVKRGGLAMKRLALVFLVMGLFLAFGGLALAADTAVKLNSSDGSTNFEVQDSSGTAKAKIDSSGNVTMTSGTDIRPTANSTSAINIAQANGTDFVTFDTTNKRVGVGTNAPDRELHLYNSSAADGNNIRMRVENNGGAKFDLIAYGGTNSSEPHLAGNAFMNATECNLLLMANGLGKFVALYTDGYTMDKERMRITSDGYVGIGTTVPTSKLQVTGLPVYANNAAAVAGGLTAGAFYRTGADPDPVCVVH